MVEFSISRLIEGLTERPDSEDAGDAPDLPPIRKRQELQHAATALTGHRLPARAVCAGHIAPFEAVADAFFGRHPVTVWKGSRGLAGKSTALALLSFLETIYFGAEVTILGGSGQQSARVQEAITRFWNAPNAPRHLLQAPPTKYQVRLGNGGRSTALMASQTSVRGPHPQRLRMDEIDEMAPDILDAALGQPMSGHGVASQVVLSSTHQHPSGTMSATLKRAREQGWPVYEWCFRETLASNGGWLDPAEVERTRGRVSFAMWRTEYELQEPSATGRAILPERVEAMFREELGVLPLDPVRLEDGEAVEFEQPIDGATYAHGADWAKEQDWCVFATLRTDVTPYRLVAYRRTGRLPWPVMIAAFCAQVRGYGGSAKHDATGIGNVVEDHLTVEAEGLWLAGKTRSGLLSEYVAAVERGEIVAPLIEYLRDEHRDATRNDLYGSGHLPDTICAMALAYRAAKDVPAELFGV